MTMDEIEQCYECESTGQNCWAHGGRERSWGKSEGADMTLVTGEPRPAAPSLADDVAKIRAELLVPAWEADEIGRQDAIAALDRIAARMPQPTRVWMHRCGVVLINDTQPPPCHVCVSTPQIPFRRLYTLGGAS